MDNNIRNSNDKDIYDESPYLYGQLYKLLSSMRADFSINTLYQLLDKPVSMTEIKHILDNVSWAENSEHNIYHFQESNISSKTTELSDSELDKKEIETDDNNRSSDSDDKSEIEKKLNHLKKQRDKYELALDEKRSEWSSRYVELHAGIYDSKLYIENLQKELIRCSEEIQQLSFFEFSRKKKLNNVIVGINKEIDSERLKRDGLIEKLDEVDKHYQKDANDIKKRINSIDSEIRCIEEQMESESDEYDIITQENLVDSNESVGIKEIDNPENKSEVLNNDNGAARTTSITVDDVLSGDGFEPDDITIDSLGLSNRAYNCLRNAGVFTMGELIKMSDEQLISIDHMGKNSVSDIHHAMIKVINKLHDEELLKRYKDRNEYANHLYNGTIIHDVPIGELGLSVRAYNCLTRQGIKNVTELFKYTKEDLLNISNMGEKSANEIIEVVHKVTKDLAGEPEVDYEDIQDANSAIDEDTKQEYYGSERFYQFFSSRINTYLSSDIDNELSYEDIKGMFSSDINNMTVIDNLKRMITDGQIINDEGVYKENLVSVLQAIKQLPEDQADFVREKLEGKTLEEIGTEAGITRERVRQIIARAMKWIRDGHKDIKAHRWLAEDKYKYLYENYDIGRSFWREINLPEYIYNYLQMEYKHGNKPVSDILEDDRVDDKIKRFVQVKQDENYIIVGDRRILRSRSAIEDYIISIYFRDEGSFEQFVEKYNEFLHENELDNDPKLKISDDVIRTRVNKLALSHNVLWKQNQRLRYYDIDGTEFTTLLDTLCLEQYHNTELSTRKFMRDYPELMDEYDIRDEYELHNLLKKICNPENYHDIVFERMPGIRFGEFDRDCAVKEMMADMSPVTREDLAEAISQEYGFKAETINANWLNCLDAYYYNGIYTMPTNSETTLSKELLSDLKGCLSEQFYFTDDLPVIIKKTLGLKHYKPSAYELKKCGFKVYSGYILKDCASSSEYFLNMLTSTDLVDLSECDPRLYSVRMFSNMLCSLKEDYEIMEYAPYKFINISRLQLMGIEKSDIRAYCRDVKKYVGIDNFFTVFWLRNVGFHNKLDDLGFEDYFYESILSADPEIHAFLQHTIEDNNSQVLYYGEERLGKKDFVRSIIRKENAIDKEDLINYCKEQYNIRIDDKLLYPIMNDSEIYYDKTMERFYSNYSVFFDEL